MMFACAVPYTNRVFFRFTRLGAVVVLASASHLVEVVVLCSHHDVGLLRILVTEVFGFGIFRLCVNVRLTSVSIHSRKASLLTQHSLNDSYGSLPLSNRSSQRNLTTIDIATSLRLEQNRGLKKPLNSRENDQKRKNGFHGKS